jgi:hypothetical protein
VELQSFAGVSSVRSDRTYAGWRHFDGRKEKNGHEKKVKVLEKRKETQEPAVNDYNCVSTLECAFSMSNGIGIRIGRGN